MKKFKRNQYGLCAKECDWLYRMGLIDTQWILDIEWSLFLIHG